MTVPLGDELVRECWRLLARGLSYQALDQAERALRLYEPPADSLLSGRLQLVVGIALASLGRREAARRYLADASWALENARDDERPLIRVVNGSACKSWGAPRSSGGTASHHNAGGNFREFTLSRNYLQSHDLEGTARGHAGCEPARLKSHSSPGADPMGVPSEGREAMQIIRRGGGRDMFPVWDVD
jgi:tetratricopeptide (TPR) repeat protein